MPARITTLRLRRTYGALSTMMLAALEMLRATAESGGALLRTEATEARPWALPHRTLPTAKTWRSLLRTEAAEARTRALPHLAPLRAESMEASLLRALGAAPSLLWPTLAEILRPLRRHPTVMDTLRPLPLCARLWASLLLGWRSLLVVIGSLHVLIVPAFARLAGLRRLAVSISVVLLRLWRRASRFIGLSGSRRAALSEGCSGAQRECRREGKQRMSKG